MDCEHFQNQVNDIKNDNSQSKYGKSSYIMSQKKIFIKNLLK